MPTLAKVRLNVQVRPDQKDTVERLARETDRTTGQVARRLLDLGLAHWSEREAVEELVEVAS